MYSIYSRKAVDVAAAANPLLKDVQIYVAQDSTSKSSCLAGVRAW